YTVLENAAPARGAEYEVYGSQILVHKDVFIDGSHIVSSEPKQELAPGGAQWVIAFELDAEGAKLFDEVAERLNNQRPPGLLAIALDGKVKSAPAVHSPSFRGKGRISGAKSYEDARGLSIILKSG